MLEDNLAAHMALLPALLPGSVVRQTDELTLVCTDVPSDMFNSVCRARLEASNVDRHIAETVDLFKGRGLPFSWWVGPGSQPEDLPSRLESHGLVEVERHTAMVLHRANLSEPRACSCLAVRRVSTHAGLMEFALVIASNCEPPDPLVIEFFSRLGEEALAGSPLNLLVGYAEGIPVATSEAFLSGNTLGLYSVSVPKEWRRRGFGAAMSHAALRSFDGWEFAVLQASGEAESVYARIGFEPCGVFREFKPPI